MLPPCMRVGFALTHLWPISEVPGDWEAGTEQAPSKYLQLRQDEGKRVLNRGMDEEMHEPMSEKMRYYTSGRGMENRMQMELTGGWMDGG